MDNDKGQRIVEGVRDIARRYPEARFEVEGTNLHGDESKLRDLERFAAAFYIRREREQEARTRGGERERIREENRARYEYGLPYDRNSYAPPPAEPRTG